MGYGWAEHTSALSFPLDQSTYITQAMLSRIYFIHRVCMYIRHTTNTTAQIQRFMVTKGITKRHKGLIYLVGRTYKYKYMFTAQREDKNRKLSLCVWFSRLIKIIIFSSSEWVMWKWACLINTCYVRPNKWSFKNFLIIEKCVRAIGIRIYDIKNNIS